MKQKKHVMREKYLNLLVKNMHRDCIKVITGIRRCGKSYLLFTLFYDYLRENGITDEQIIQIKLDEKKNESLRNPDVLYQYLQEKIADEKKEYYVLLDEAQFAISNKDLQNRDKPLPLYDILNELMHRPNVDVYITGSNSKFLSTDVMTEFRGRGKEIHIQPLVFSEFCNAFEGTTHEAWEQYLFYGGMPALFQEDDDESKLTYLKSLFSEIYLKDIKERYGVRNDSGMEELVNIVASSIGAFTNPQRIANTFKSEGGKAVSEPTITDYLQYLQDSFVIQKAERYDIKGRHYIGTPSKYYFSDIGLRNARLNFRQIERSHIMENIIYNELVYRGYSVDVGVVEANVTENGKSQRRQFEVDFVANKGSERLYIQSALNLDTREKTEQEQNSLIRIPDSFKRIIITEGDMLPWHTEAGSEVIGVERWLLEK
ncbi:MAG: ATP-binding protein [Treponema sp.]|nr:ATP-binding protein [Treponema sp.]